MPGHQVLHHSDESPALSAAPLEQFQLACEGHCFLVEVGVHHSADQGHDLMDTCGILFKQQPYQWLSLGQAIGGQ